MKISASYMGFMTGLCYIVLFTWPTVLVFGPTQYVFYQKIPSLSSRTWTEEIRHWSMHTTNFSILPKVLFIIAMCKVSRTMYILANRRSLNKGAGENDTKEMYLGMPEWLIWLRRRS